MITETERQLKAISNELKILNCNLERFCEILLKNKKNKKDKEDSNENSVSES